MQLRHATLDDTQTISHLFRHTITRWQRIRPDGYAEDVPYEQLTIYERWLHGGAWMSIETASIWLSHILSTGGRAYVLTDDQAHIIAYAETFFHTTDNDHITLHIAHLIAHPDDQQARHTLLDTLIHQPPDPYHHLTLATSAYDESQIAFCQQHDLTQWRTVQRVTIPAITGQSFYQAVPHTRTDVTQIKGWRMPIGDAQSPRYYWETLWHDHWRALPAITAQTTHRLYLNASGQDAFLCLQQHLYEPRSADVYCWTPKPLSAQLLVAIRDWAHRQGYRSLSLYVTDAITQLLGDEIETQPQRQIVYRISPTKV